MKQKLFTIFALATLPAVVFSDPIYKPMTEAPDFSKLKGFIVVGLDVFVHPDEMKPIAKDKFFEALQQGQFTGDLKDLENYPSISSFYRYGTFSLSDGTLFMWRMHRPDVITITDEEGREGNIICPPDLPFKPTGVQESETP